MVSGLLSGILWALDTVIIGLALNMVPFISTSQTILLAPFIGSFIHDMTSAIYMLCYMAFKKDFKGVTNALKTKSGRFISLGSLLAGPIGMSGYVAAIKYMGPSYTAIVSSLYPAVGVLLSHIFLKGKMNVRQLIGLVIAIISILFLSLTPQMNKPTNFTLGMIFGSVCCIGWASEAVIVSYGFKDSSITDVQALQIRQTTSAIAYGIVLLPLLKGWYMVPKVMMSHSFYIIMIASMFGTLSYFCYYKSISRIGAIKSMTLNIMYVAWAILFSWLILNKSPAMMELICGLFVITGSIVSVKK